MFDTIVVGVDGSDHSYKAVEYAVDIARLAGSTLLLLTAFRPIRMPDSSHSMVRPQLHPDPADTRMFEKAREVVEAAGDWARKRGAAKVETYARHGPPARTLVSFAHEKNASAIVVGSRGLGDVSGYLLGSVSQKISHMADCTCIIVK
jgi:nucleotide-binding universal stress UspA family protein